MLKVGDKAPKFNLESDNAGKVKTTDLKGKRWVLFFYPADDTPGCTKEACSFRDHVSEFDKLDIPVFGISPQDVHSKSKFRAKYSLNFPLLADDDHKVADAFGVWVLKNMMGREYMGVQRSTFVIGPTGTIERVWEKVHPEGHAEEVLAALKDE